MNTPRKLFLSLKMSHIWSINSKRAHPIEWSARNPDFLLNKILFVVKCHTFCYTLFVPEFLKNEEEQKFEMLGFSPFLEGFSVRCKDFFLQSHVYYHSQGLYLSLMKKKHF